MNQLKSLSPIENWQLFYITHRCKIQVFGDTYVFQETIFTTKFQQEPYGFTPENENGPQYCDAKPFKDNSDNRLIKEKLGWEPSFPLRKGLEITYVWVEKQVKKLSFLKQVK